MALKENFDKVCDMAEKVIRPYLGNGREVLIAVCRCGGLTDVCPGNVVEGGDKAVRGILYCPRGEFWGSVHNHPTRPDIPSSIDIYAYLTGSLGGYMCIASEKTGHLSCYWLTRTYHTPEVKRLVELMNTAIAAFNRGDRETYKEYVIKSKKYMINFRCCRKKIW